MSKFLPGLADKTAEVQHSVDLGGPTEKSVHLS